MSQEIDADEVIIVNDGSSEEETRRLHEIIADRKVKIINQENSGPSTARNKGVSEAQGNYVVFLDSDDHINKEAIKVFKEEIKSKPQVDVFIPVSQLFGGKNETKGTAIPNKLEILKANPLK